MLDEKLSVAPMMEWTDRHYRYFLRGVTKRTVLYTEMVVDDAITHSPNLDILIGNDIDEEPSVIQVGGHNPESLGKAAEICSQYGGQYGEINLNCGCPSQRVSKRCFGAKLMEEPELVRQIVYEMQRRTHQLVTVKCRLGVDNKDSYEELCNFITSVHQGGVKKFVIHSRKCILKGLNTKQNRDIPPLKYDVVHRLVKEFPDLTFVLNGGITTLQDAEHHMKSPWTYTTTKNKNDKNISGSSSSGSRSSSSYESPSTDCADDSPIHNNNNNNNNNDDIQTEEYPGVHGVMIGRAAYYNPLLFMTADSTFFHQPDPQVSRRDLIERYIRYCEYCQSENGPHKITFKKQIAMITTSILLKPIHNIMNGCHYVSKYKQVLNDLYVDGVKKGNPNPSCREIIEGAMECISDEDLDKNLVTGEYIP